MDTALGATMYFRGGASVSLRRQMARTVSAVISRRVTSASEPGSGSSGVSSESLEGFLDVIGQPFVAAIQDRLRRNLVRGDVDRLVFVQRFRLDRCFLFCFSSLSGHSYPQFSLF